MGGDFGGNGSVVWNVYHGPKGSPTGPVHSTTAGDPNNNEVKVSGKARGKDGVATPQYFTVTLRFKDGAAADNAWATKTIDPLGSEILVALKVPANQTRQNRNADQPLEVQVDWEYASTGRAGTSQQGSGPTR